MTTDGPAPNTEVCPFCGQPGAAPILYGLYQGPAGPGVVYGGCVIWPDSPNLHCNGCGYEWGRVDEWPEQSIAERRVDDMMRALRPKAASSIRGFLIGGAVGDALGAPVEFMSIDEIRSKYGPAGISGYVSAGGLPPGSITDDTQMTLFTAEGILRAHNRMLDRGICNVAAVVHRSYLRWLITQGEPPENIEDPEFGRVDDGWLITQEVLHARRGPGSTCLSALRSRECGSLEYPINDSKGCGGVMRAAPAALESSDPFGMGCEIAAITHGHPSGYLPAGFLAGLISELVLGRDLDAAMESTAETLRTQARCKETLAAIRASRELATTGKVAPEAVETLGAGWTGEEALAIALFASLTADDFLSGVLAAVNHSGDSDSTGAIAGNILGARFGVEAIPEELIEQLEVRELIEQIADDLVRHFVEMEPGGEFEDVGRYPTY